MGITLLVVAAGCGYSVGSSLPAKYRTVAVPMFKSELRETDLQAAVTNALRRRIALDGRLRLTGEKDADLVVRGTLTRYTVRSRSYFDDDEIARFRARIGATVTLEDGSTGKILWHATDVDGSSEHFTSDAGERTMSRGATRYFVPDATSFPTMEEGQGAAEAVEDLALDIFIRLMEY